MAKAGRRERGYRVAGHGPAASRMRKVPTPRCALSIVIPAHNEAPSLPDVIDEILSAWAGESQVEVVVVDDGSTDDTRAVVESLDPTGRAVRLVVLGRNLGKTAAVYHGVRNSSGEWIACLDGDGQNDPCDLRRMWDLARAVPGTMPLLVIGRRVHRADTFAKITASAVARWLLAFSQRHERFDAGCGMQVFRRADYLALPKFDHMHRFMPTLYRAHGWRVLSEPVLDRPRRHGVSHYGNTARAVFGLHDLIGVHWLSHRLHASVPEPGARQQAPRL